MKELRLPPEPTSVISSEWFCLGGAFVMGLWGGPAIVDHLQAHGVSRGGSIAISLPLVVLTGLLVGRVVWSVWITALAFRNAPLVTLRILAIRAFGSVLLMIFLPLFALGIAVVWVLLGGRVP